MEENHNMKKEVVLTFLLKKMQRQHLPPVEQQTCPMRRYEGNAANQSTHDEEVLNIVDVL
ncbi:hypothetical protein FACS189472_10630 [Alphaproteobacteria bacterium]|nr:hypothetical protein FACS189472_10630 [Alphaproteobacteria bacterium]